MSHYFKHKPNASQHGFFETKSTTTTLVTYLDFIFLLVSSQRQVHSIYCNLSSAFDIVLQPILLHKFCAYGPSDGLVNWFRSYLTNRRSSACILDIFSFSFEVPSGVPQESVFGPLLFNILTTL